MSQTTKQLIENVRNKLRNLYPDGVRALAEPELDVSDTQAVADCLASGYVSTASPQVEQFETKLAAICDVRHAVALNSGTSALHLMLLAAGVKQDDEVLIPALSFIATANAVSYCGAIAHFCECEPQTLGIDPQALERYLQHIAILSPEGCRNRYSGRIIRALMPVHNLGHTGDLIALRILAERYKLALLFDGAAALGSTFRQQSPARFGLATAISFNGNKIITSGAGGAIVTDSDALAQSARHLATVARHTHHGSYIHSQVGFNFRMPGLCAALASAQLERLAQRVARKRAWHAQYVQLFSDCSGCSVYTPPDYSQSNCWLSALLIEEDDARLQQQLIDMLHQHAIAVRSMWMPLYRQPPYIQHPRMDSPTAERLSRTLICLPGPSAEFIHEGRV